jgi:hypothetical protein
MIVPYIPEGLRFELPHRNHLQETINESEINHSFHQSHIDRLEPQPDLESKIPEEVSERDDILNADTVVDMLRIFQASFELVIQLHDDWMNMSTEILIHLTPSESIAVHQRSVAAVERIRFSGISYCPLLMKNVESSSTSNLTSCLVVLSDDELYDFGAKILDIQDVLYKSFNSENINFFLV